MLRFIFYNSYQSSLVGYQSSYIEFGSQELQRISDKYPGTEETKSLLFKSGVICAVGKAQNSNIRYLALKALHTVDESQRPWFINFALEADDEAAGQFECLAANILLNKPAFLEKLAHWFSDTPESELSYKLNIDCFQNDISLLSENVQSVSDYFRTDNFKIRSFMKMADKLQNDDYDNVLLLVPEFSLDYFYNQNPSFKRALKKYIINNDDFSAITDQKEIVEKVHNNQRETGKNASQNRNNPLSALVGDDSQIDTKLIAAVALGATAAVGAGILIKKIIKG